MLYEGPTRTLLVLVPPGERPAPDAIAGHAARRGTTTDEGPVAQVAYVFLGGLDEALEALPALEPHGLEVRALDDGTGEEVVLSRGTRPDVALHEAREALVGVLAARAAQLRAPRRLPEPAVRRLPRPGAPGVRAPAAPGDPLANWSLLLGVGSLCCGGPVGLFAVAVGGQALSRGTGAEHRTRAWIGVGLGVLTFGAFALRMVACG